MLVSKLAAIANVIATRKRRIKKATSRQQCKNTKPRQLGRACLPFFPPSSIWAPFLTSPYGRRAHLISAADAPKQPHAPPPPPATAEICRDGGNSSNEFARSRRRWRRLAATHLAMAGRGRPHNAIPSFLPSLPPSLPCPVCATLVPPSRSFFLPSNCFGLADMREFRSVSTAPELRNESPQISTERNSASPRDETAFLHCRLLYQMLKADAV